MINLNERPGLGEDLVKDDTLKELYTRKKLYKTSIKVRKFDGEIFTKECYIKPEDLNSIKAVVDIIDFEKKHTMFIDSDGKSTFHSNNKEEIFNG